MGWGREPARQDGMGVAADIPLTSITKAGDAQGSTQQVPQFGRWLVNGSRRGPGGTDDRSQIRQRCGKKSMTVRELWSQRYRPGCARHRLHGKSSWRFPRLASSHVFTRHGDGQAAHRRPSVPRDVAGVGPPIASTSQSVAGQGARSESASRYQDRLTPRLRSTREPLGRLHGHWPAPPTGLPCRCGRCRE